MDTNELRERIATAKGDEAATVNLIAELGVRTIDGVLITHGMRVVDYNLDWTTVTGIQSVDNVGTVWFKTTTGMFDGSRLWARMP